MRRPSASLVVFCIISVSILVANFWFRTIKTAQTKPLTLNSYAIGNIEDYHQYMYILKRGAQGKLLYHNAYSEESIPDVFIQPFYHVAGWVFGALHISIYDTYFMLHLLGFIFLFFAIYMLIQRTIVSEIGRVSALLLYISATGFWKISSLSPISLTRMYLPDFNFDLFIKYHVMQPHHDVAIALFILAILSLSHQAYSIKQGIVGGVSAALLGLIHPYIQLFLFFVLIVDHIVRILLLRQSYIQYIKHYSIPILIALPTSILTYYIFVHVLQFEIGLKGVVTYLQRDQTFYQYMVSVGPLLFISGLSLVYVQKILNNGLVRLTFIWAYLPFILFFLPDYHIPINTWRLFQTYQHIPLAILGAYSFVRVSKKIPKFGLILPILAVAALCYGLPMYAYGFYESTRPVTRLIWTVDIPLVLIKVCTFLNTTSKPDSIVLAGPQMSNLLPEFSHNRVIIGHNGDNRNFITKYIEIVSFLKGQVPIDAVKPFLERYHVSYIVFGIDAPIFKNTPYATLPFLKEVFVEPVSGFSVVAVQSDK